ncbi:hypothetical protein MTO96_019135 [Rhipicephalus appendiculatus]
MPRQRNGDVTTSEGSQEPLRFFVLPKDEQTHSIVPLPHPKTEASSLYLKADSGEYLELVKFKEKRGSWIVDDFVEPDGSLYVATPMDPLFFAVALLQKSDKFRPLEDFVEDNSYPHLLNVIRSCSNRLQHIADVKELGEDRVYRYNESKCVGATCVSAALVRSKRDTRPTNEDYMVTAHSIVADYVPPALGLLLKSSLGLDKRPAADKKAETPSSPPPKKQRTEQVEPLEDYSQGTPKNGLFKPAKTPKLTASQKKLQKVDKTGMKSISSFFGKK